MNIHILKTNILTLGLLLAFSMVAKSAQITTNKDCTSVSENDKILGNNNQCFCYRLQTEIGWNIWSTFQVNVTGDDGVHIVFPLERNLNDSLAIFGFLRSSLNHYWPFFKTQNEKWMDIALVDEDVCFLVKSINPQVHYYLHVTERKFNKYQFSLFCCGAILYYLAGALCRSTIFYYCVGLCLSILSISVLTVFMLERFVPKGIFVFLFCVSSALTFFGIQHLVIHWNDIIPFYWRYVGGYVLFSSFLSFAICYKHGPIMNEVSSTFLTWTLQAVAMILMYKGITHPPAMYAVFAILVTMKILPFAKLSVIGIFRKIWCLLRNPFGCSSQEKAQYRFLTEEEYREQGEIYTRTCLDELREHCRKPGYSAWETVLKLRSPQRFADFLMSGLHVTTEEFQTHEHQYGVGGAYFENMIFSAGKGNMPTPEWNSSHLSRDISEDELEYYEPRGNLVQEGQVQQPEDLELF
ncbi:nuclear envelope integral membrane protein 2 [Lepisosteus oculatus]|uniref:nuclear envelope integral membrane protein 2 n=1 Tax=Lepisosteus oculatus TaxID=7918 RepID=UPI0035F515B4